jgi:hypothetical protein
LARKDKILAVGGGGGGGSVVGDKWGDSKESMGIFQFIPTTELARKDKIYYDFFS